MGGVACGSGPGADLNLELWSTSGPRRADVARMMDRVARDTLWRQYHVQRARPILFIHIEPNQVPGLYWYRVKPPHHDGLRVPFRRFPLSSSQTQKSTLVLCPCFKWFQRPPIYISNRVHCTNIPLLRVGGTPPRHGLSIKPPFCPFVRAS